MPRIFEKDCKINVIEYGDHCSQVISFTAIKDKIVSTITSMKKAA